MRLVSLLALLPTAAAAHPHVFVDATVEVLIEAGAVAGVRLTWTYDDLFSLMLTEDLEIDGDGDLALTETEIAALQASVTDWPPDYDGDLVVELGDVPLPLGAPEDHSVAFEGGAVVETHLRPLVEPALTTTEPIVVKVFDPYYYVAYTITDAAVTGDPACAATLVRADQEAAQAEVDATWAGIDWANAAPDVQLPPIGEPFSDRVEVRCGG